MRILPRLSLTAHSLLELVAGLTLTLAAITLDLGGAGTLALFAAGVTLAGIGLGAIDALPLAAHQTLDRTVVVVLAAVAVGCALTGSELAAVILLGAAACVLVLEATTRWTRPMAR